MIMTLNENKDKIVFNELFLLEGKDKKVKGLQ